MSENIGQGGIAGRSESLLRSTSGFEWPEPLYRLRVAMRLICEWQMHRLGIRTCHRAGGTTRTVQELRVLIAVSEHTSSDSAMSNVRANNTNLAYQIFFCTGSNYGVA
jgi:hypothetical protein